MKYLKFLFAISNIILCCACVTKEKSNSDSTIQEVAPMYADTLSLGLDKIHQLLNEIIKSKKLSVDKIDEINKQIDVLSVKVQKYVLDKKLKRPIPPGTVDSLVEDVMNIQSQLEDIEISSKSIMSTTKTKPKDKSKRVPIPSGITYKESLVVDSMETLSKLSPGHYVARINRNSIVRFGIDDKLNVINPILVEDTVVHMESIITNHKILRQIRRFQIRRIKNEIN